MLCSTCEDIEKYQILYGLLAKTDGMIYKADTNSRRVFEIIIEFAQIMLKREQNKLCFGQPVISLIDVKVKNKLIDEGIIPDLFGRDNPLIKSEFL